MVNLLNFEKCIECQMFTGKTYKEPIQPNNIPDECWEEVSIDLFGPLPSSNHIIVIQDLASRFPVAKVIPSTSGKHVIPVLAETYNTFGNPDIQKSDNEYTSILMLKKFFLGNLSLLDM